jgi:flavodoxin
MKITVVYESHFNNTAAVARAVGDAMSAEHEVKIVSVDEALAAPPSDCDLLIVGAPTHAFGMTLRMTRLAASEEARKIGHEPTKGVRSLLKTLPRVKKGAAAAFDTRIKKWWTGSAARGIARVLRRKGYRLVAAPENFHVVGTEGPLLEGEIERAKAWAAHIVDRLDAGP